MITDVCATDLVVATELHMMDETAIEDAYYRDLIFYTGGFRSTIVTDTNRMNVYAPMKASQGFVNYLGTGVSVVIDYGNRLRLLFLQRLLQEG